MPDKASQVKLFGEVVDKYKDKLTKDPVDTCRGFKIMLHSIHKMKDMRQEISQSLGILIPLLISNLQGGSSTLLVSSQLDLLGTLLDLKLLPETERGKTGQFIAEGLKSSKDNNMRVVLKGYQSKFSKGKAVSAAGEGVS